MTRVQTKGFLKVFSDAFAVYGLHIQHTLHTYFKGLLSFQTENFEI